MITKDQVIEIAQQCFDPEIPVNIWDLGLIYDIQIDKSTETVKIRMSLTSQACPSAQQIPQDLKNRLLAQPSVKDAQIEIVFDPPWTPERISEEGKRKLGIVES